VVAAAGQPGGGRGGRVKPTQMQSGTVSWYSAEMGFGFITPAEGGADVVIYAEALKAAGIEKLTEGEAVSFETEPERRARKAVAIKRT